MKYKSYLDNITKSLKTKQQSIDILTELFKEEKNKFKETVGKMSGIYTQAFIDEHIKKWKPENNYSFLIAKTSEKALAEVAHYSECLKRELDKYFNAFIRPEFASQIASLKATQMPLRDREFEVLAETAANYMELRAVQNFAESRTEKQIKAITDTNGITTNQEVEVKIPFHINIPDIDVIYREFDNMVSAVKSYAVSYAGKNAELKEFLDTSISEFAPLTATRFFYENNCIERLTKELEKASALLPENKVKQELTEGDRKFIDTVINPAYPALAETTVKNIVKNGANSELLELLRLDERYSQYVLDAEEEEEKKNG